MTVYRAVIWTRDALHSPSCTLSTTARLLLYELAAHTDVDGTCHPSVERLSEGLGITAANVRRARAELVAAGLVAVDHGGGRGRANLYRFPFVAHPAANGDRPPEARNPRTTARVRSPQPDRQRAGSLSTTRASARGTYPEPARRNGETRAVPRVNPRATARPSSTEVVVTEVARSRRRTNGARDPLGALLANGMNPFSGRRDD